MNNEDPENYLAPFVLAHQKANRLAIYKKSEVDDDKTEIFLSLGTKVVPAHHDTSYCW